MPLVENELSPEDPFLTKAPVKEVKKTFIIARDSLPGGWKPIGEEEMEELERKDRARRGGKTRRAWRMSQVEVLDLSQE